MLLTFIFFQNPISLALALIGASLPDFDHDIKKSQVHMIIIIGFLIFELLFVLKLPYFLGLILCLLAIIFYFSNHRGFTHSILGILILTTLIFLIIILGSSLIISSIPFSIKNLELIAISIIILLLSCLIVNNKLILITIFLLSLPFIFSSIYYIDYFLIFVSLFLGFLSHLILDSFTPSGIKIARPFSSKKVHKKFGLISLLILFLIAIPNLFLFFNLILAI